MEEKKHKTVGVIGGMGGFPASMADLASHKVEETQQQLETMKLAAHEEPHPLAEDLSRTKARKKKVKGTPQKFDAPKVHRNDPCPCGSGNKFKKCCI